MKNIAKEVSLKEKLQIIKEDIQKRREKKDLDEGSIVFFGEGNKFGICISKDKLVTLEDSDINAKVINEDIYYSSEYFIGCIGNEIFKDEKLKYLANEYNIERVNNEVFKDEKLKEIAQNSIGENNILRLRYKNSYDFLNQKINFLKNKDNKAKTFKEIREVLEKEYGINKWLSSFTNLSIKEFEEKIEEKKLEEEKLEEEYEEKLKENIEKIEDVEADLKTLEEYEQLLENDLLNEDDKEEIINQMNNLPNKEELINLLEELKEEEKEIEDTLKEEKENINEEIKNLKEKIDEIKENEINESKETSKELESNMKKLEKDLEKADQEKLEEILEEMGNLASLKKEISNENIDGKEEIISFIEGLEKSNADYIQNKELIRGWGLSLGEFKNLGPKFLNLLSKYEKNSKLKKLIEKIGRKSKDEDKQSELFDKINLYGKEEVLGVELGDDIMRVLPSELVYLSNPETEDIFYLKYSEKKLLCYSLIGNEQEEKEKRVETEEKGAIIALLDTSGSMYGYPIENARALLLQAFKIAKNDKRDMRVMLFGSYGEIKEYVVDTKYDINKFVNYISGGFNGGTDFETPISKAIDVVTKDEKYKFADIFMLTDGACGISKKLETKIKEAKNKLDIKLYTVIFGGYGLGDIDNFSDEIFKV